MFCMQLLIAPPNYENHILRHTVRYCDLDLQLTYFCLMHHQQVIKEMNIKNILQKKILVQFSDNKQAKVMLCVNFKFV